MEEERQETEEKQNPEKHWYVIHTYSGYENKVKANLERKVRSMGLDNKIFNVIVPLEDDVEMQNGRKKIVKRKVFPGYVLVQMIVDDQSWYVVRNTPGVTGFVGSVSTQPIPLTEEEVNHILRPEGESIRRRPMLDVQPGQQVLINSGAFESLPATVAEVVKKAFLMGTMITATDTIDFDTASLIAMEFHAKVEKEVVVTIEERLIDDSEDDDANLVGRAPVVVVMGHVDHGKTSILDAIRHANVTAGEAGGITQHIGAYRVQVNGKPITFLDTPGHEAFTTMRARGAQVTDIAILVVAADDGIMPQTVEAINHAKAAGVSVIVAINKMDKVGANPEQVKQQLTEYELIPEEWGGDTPCIPVSAKTKEGLDDLLEMVALVAEMKELKANPDRAAKGTVIEARLEYASQGRHHHRRNNSRQSQSNDQRQGRESSGGRSVCSC